MLCLFRSRIPNPGNLSSSFLRIHARRPFNSHVPLLREYATRKSSTPPRSSVSRLKLPTRPPPPPANSRREAKTALAQTLFKAGDKILYRSTRRTTLFRVHSWTLMLTAGVGVASLWSNGFLDSKTFRDMNHKYPNLIVIAYSAACIFLGGIIGFALFRSRNHIDRIDLIQQTGRTLLQVTSRSEIPFVKKRLIVQPNDFIVNDPFAAVSNLPTSLIPLAPSESSPSAFTAGVIRESLKTISRSLYSFVDFFNAYYTRRGMYDVDVVRENRATAYTMDAAGEYLIMEDKIVLWDVVETKDYGFH